MSKPEKHFYEFGPFRLDPAERLVLREDRPVPLTPNVIRVRVSSLSLFMMWFLTFLVLDY